jgi:hypothetical protein
MIRPIQFAMVAALAATSPSFAQELSTVQSIDVTADLSAVNNAEAAAYWASLDTDLESAIATRLGDRIADEGIEITVDVEEVSLSNGFTDAIGLADTRLVGDINVVDEADRTRNQFYQLAIDVNMARPMMVAGTDEATLPTDTRVFYDAMVNAFADALVRDLR